MSDGCDQGDGGSEQRKLKSPRDSSEVEDSRRAAGQKASRPVIIYTVSPKPIHVEAQDFKEVVQRLTGKSGNQGKDSAEEHSAAQLPQSPNSSGKSQEASEGSTGPQQISPVSSQLALEDYLDRLDKENPSPQPSSNLGFFPTAGLVKGVDLELGLQWRTAPDEAPDSVGASSPRPSKSLSPEAFELKDNPDGD